MFWGRGTVQHHDQIGISNSGEFHKVYNAWTTFYEDFMMLFLSIASLYFREARFSVGWTGKDALEMPVLWWSGFASGVGLGYFRLFGGMNGVHVFQAMFPKYGFSQLRFDKWWGPWASDDSLSSEPREQLVCVASWITRIYTWKESCPPPFEGGTEPRELS